MHVNKMIVYGLIGLVIIAGSVWLYQKYSNGSPKVINEPYVIRYLPLGDSYTIGNLVSEEDRWPNQLVAVYMPGGKRLEILDNPARSGYTTQDLIDRELPLVGKLKPDFITVQIGANDYFQGIDAQTFEKNFRYIISQIKQGLASPGNILLVTIPDYAKTPSGVGFGDPARATEGIKNFNQIIIKVANDENLPVADVFEVSQAVVNDPSLVVDDGLHPSAKQYEAWTQIIKAKLIESKIPK
jgi:lysophospholipase L1-like esterase